MLLLIGTIYFFYVILKLYISYAEIGFVMQAKYLPAVILSHDNYKKAADYKIASEKFNALLTLYDYMLFLCWILFGFSTLEAVVMREYTIFESVVFVVAFIAINYILTLPFDIYSIFFKDKKFGFSTISVKIYMLDMFKTILLFTIFGGGIIAIISWIIATFPFWWLYAYAVIFIFILFINMFYPTFIAPLFNKFVPLEDGELKSSIESLMLKVGLKSSGVFTVDASKRDNRLNAYFGGLGKSKRVVLFDTLIKKLDSHELLSVLCHELGHFKHKDILKNIFAMAALLFILFVFFGNLPLEVYEAFGLTGGAHSTIVIFLLLSSIVSFAFMPLFGLLSRTNEYKADKYASECEGNETLAKALVKLANENKSFPRSHFLYIAFYYTHPPLIERLKALGVDE